MIANTCKILIFIIFLLSPVLSVAQEKAEIYGPIQLERQKGIVVLELFSSQACVFCPKADAMMKDFAAQDQMIALSCHVDYFDVKIGSLALPVCSERQSNYEAALRAGPKYTPQMILNGRFETVGYRKADVMKTLQRAALEPVLPFTIENGPGLEQFSFTLPESEKQAYTLWFVRFDIPRDVNVADGANRGQSFTYYNVVSDMHSLGAWDGKAKTLTFEGAAKEYAKGFAVLVQNNATQHIVLAGKYLIKM